MPEKTSVIQNPVAKDSILSSSIKEKLNVDTYAGKKNICLLPYCFHKPIYALIFICVLIICQGMLVSGNLIIIISSIEKRFGYKSYQTGIITSVYELSFGFSGILVSYIGRNGRKLKYLAFGANLMSLGCVFFALPQFIYSSYYPNINQSSIDCSSYMNTESCDSSSALPLVLFCIGYSLIGIGSSPIYTLGCSYIDEITTHGQNGLYLGFMYTCAALGPAFGFILGKPFLMTWVDVNLPENLVINSNSNDWIGAWWMGSCVYAILLILCSVPLHLFPSNLNTGTLRIIKESQASGNEMLSTPKENIFYQLKCLMKNHMFMILTFVTMIDGISSSGIGAFLSKHIENNFHQKPEMASLYTGFVVVPGAGGGLILGGLCVKKFKWIGRPLLFKIVIVVALAFCVSFILLFGCPQRPIEKDKSSSCTSSCICTNARFEPICSDSKSYYSPCLLGCTYVENNVTRYSNCSCSTAVNNEIIDGYCPSSCNYLLPYMFGALLLMALTFFPNVPLLDATLRSVDSNLSSLALGLQQSVVRIGFVIGPVLYGAIIDITCIDWKTNQCNVRHNCQIYDTRLFRQLITIPTASIKLTSSILLLIGGFTWKLNYQS